MGRCYRCPWMQNLRGQAWNEYLILLAVVLMVFFAATTLLTWNFQGPKSGLNESEAYWKAARPLSVEFASTLENGTLVISVKNHGEPALLNAVIFNHTMYEVTRYLSKGEKAILSFTLDLKSETGVCSIQLQFDYGVVGVLNVMVKGEKPLVVRCPKRCKEVGESCLFADECCSGQCRIGTCSPY